MKKEVDKRPKIGFVREANYPRRLTKVVMVRKTPVKWWMYIAFTNQNKACPKASFLLPHVDKLADSTTGPELLSFMDTYSGYNQILTYPPY